jgi:hypothetical protein
MFGSSFSALDEALGPLDDPDRGAVGDEIGAAHDHLISGGEARSDFNQEPCR